MTEETPGLGEGLSKGFGEEVDATGLEGSKWTCPVRADQPGNKKGENTDVVSGGLRGQHPPTPATQTGGPHWN